MLIFTLITLILLFFDQLTKVLASSQILLNHSVDVIPNFIYFTYQNNTGMAWSLLSDGTAVLALLSTLIGFGIYFYTLKKLDFKHNKFLMVIISMIVAGTLGNMIDRWLTVFKIREGVIDFFGVWLGSYQFPIFNLADSLLVVGIILLAIYILFFEKKYVPKNQIKGDVNE